jgi:hypothetical protein
MGCEGAGACAMASHRRQENFSRTCWITFHCAGTASSVSLMFSPSFLKVPPQLGQVDGAACTMRSRGRCWGSGRRAGLSRSWSVIGALRRLDLGARPVLWGSFLKLAELQLELIEELGTALRRGAKLVAAHFRDGELEGFDLPSAGDHHRLQGDDVIRELRRIERHAQHDSGFAQISIGRASIIHGPSRAGHT